MNIRAAQVVWGTSCCAAAIAWLGWLNFSSLKGNSLFVVVAINGLGLASGLIGLTTSQKQDRIISLVGLGLNIPPAYFALVVYAVVTGQHH